MRVSLDGMPPVPPPDPNPELPDPTTIRASFILLVAVVIATVLWLRHTGAP